jgi:cytochrome c oxidase assembly protein subunit 11
MGEDAARTGAEKNRRTLVLLVGLVVGMFGFGFAMVPLYNLFCQITGVQSVELRSSVGDQGFARARLPQEAVDRFVTVKFDATVNAELSWDFEPMQRKMRVQPGKTYQMKYVAKNRTGRTIVGQALPSVVPWQATGYFHKLECFCFTQQTLKGGETQEMPLQFSVSPDLPAGINSLTLSYTFMKSEQPVQADKTNSLSGEQISNKL